MSTAIAVMPMAKKQEKARKESRTVRVYVEMLDWTMKVARLKNMDHTEYLSEIGIEAAKRDYNAIMKKIQDTKKFD